MSIIITHLQKGIFTCIASKATLRIKEGGLWSFGGKFIRQNSSWGAEHGQVLVTLDEAVEACATLQEWMGLTSVFLYWAGK